MLEVLSVGGGDYVFNTFNAIAGLFPHKIKIISGFNSISHAIPDLV